MLQVRSLKSGFTLVELIVVMACVSVLTGLAINLYFQAFGLEMQVTVSSQWTQSTNRLVNQFREDVHQYGKPESSENSTLELPENTLIYWNLDGEIISYGSRQGKFPGEIYVQRNHRKGDQNLAKEDYRLPDHTSVRFQWGTDSDQNLIALGLWTAMPGLDQVAQTELGKSVNFDQMNLFTRTFSDMPNQPKQPAFTRNCRIVFASFAR